MNVSHETDYNFRLPVMSIPKFNGKHTKWLEFRDSYESLIHNSKRLSNIQKVHYLKSFLEDNEAKIIGSMVITATNYDQAWSAVCEEYENKYLLIQNHIKALLNLEHVYNETPCKLREMLNEVSQHLRALKLLGQPTESWDSILIFIITRKLDEVTTREWEAKRVNMVDGLPTLEELKTFLRQKVVMLDSVARNQTEEKRPTDRSAKGKSTARAFTTANVTCHYCKGDHTIYSCDKFSALAVNERVKQARAMRLCTNCLQPGHFASACRRDGCPKCHLKHNSILHINANSGREKSETTTTMSAQTIFNSDLLSTIAVNVISHNGKLAKARALLDNGAQSNFIQLKLAKQLNLQIKRINLTVSGINNFETEIIGSCELIIESRVKNIRKRINCLVVTEVSGPLPQRKIDISDWEIPETIQLADPNFAARNPINLLLGVRLFWESLESGAISIGANKPTLRETQWGWIFAGSIPEATKIGDAKCFLTQNRDVQAQLERFWQIEECDNAKILSDEERFCEEHFRDNIQRNKDGRFIVSIPFLKSPSLLGDSKNTARKRFLNLERRMQANAKFKNAYVDFMSEYIALGHMTEQRENTDRNEYFLPHHGVLKEASQTTKLRVVFDASCPTTSGYSLNNLQAVGPTIQDDVFEVLVRFRQHIIAITGDIAKMYRQVLVREPERAFQKIFWREQPSEPLKIYILNTVTYGTASASFLAIRCLQSAAEAYSNKYEKAAEIIQKDFYVDDLLTGASTAAEASTLIAQITEILNDSCFPLRKFVSNKPHIFEKMPELKCHDHGIMNLGENENSKTLGLFWDPREDNLRFQITELKENIVLTKREVLSAIGQTFCQEAQRRRI